MMRFRNKQKARKGIWASLDLMLSLLIIVGTLAPAIEYSSLHARQAMQSAHYSRLLSYAIQDSSELYFHGAARKEESDFQTFAMIGNFDLPSYENYSVFASGRARKHLLGAYYHIAAPDGGKAGLVCTSRIMLNRATPVFPVVCVEGLK